MTPSPGAGGLTRLVWALSVPILFAEVAEAVIHVTDTALLARVGTVELAAIAVADIARELWIVPAIGLAEAAQIVIARRVGAGDPDAIGATFARGLVLAGLVAVALAATLTLVADVVAGWLVTTPEVAQAVADFLRLAAWGLPLQALGMVFGSLFVGIGRARALFGATAVLAVVNLGVSAVLIFGALGLPQLGIEGAAIGYIAAEAAALAYLVAYALRREEIRSLGLWRLRGARAPGAPALARLGAPIALQGMVESARWLIFFVILERVGPEAVAWSNLVYACFALLVIPTYAFGETAYTLVSRVIGRGDDTQIGTVVGRTIAPAALVTLPFAAAALAFPEAVLAVFTDDPDAVEGAATALRVVAATMLLVIPAELWLAAVSGTGDTDAAFVLEVLATVVMLAAAYLTAILLDLDLALVWLSLGLSSLIGLPLGYAWVRAGRWRRRVI